MARNYIRDGLNPRGAEYGATARGANAAEHTQQSMDDMLDLAMAPDEPARQQIAQQIYDRKQGEARSASRGRVVKYIVLTLIAVFCVLVYQLGDDSSAVSGAYRAFMATPTHRVPDAQNAPVRPATAPDAQVSDDADAAYARGVDVLHAAGVSDAQIYGNAQ